MKRSRRHRLAVRALVRFAKAEPELYDELADSGDIKQRWVDIVDTEMGAAANA